MGRIVGAVQRVVADDLAGTGCMDKVAVADIDTNMRSPRRIVSPLEENQIAGSHVGS